MTDANGVVTDYAFDAKGQLQYSVQFLSNGNRTTTYGYNHNRQVADIGYASGRADRYRYTPSGRLQYVGNALNEFVSFGVDVASNTRTTSSSRAVATLSGSTPTPSASGQFSATTRSDSLGRPYTVLGNNGQQVGYTYDANGNLKTRRDAGGRGTSYDYDALNRLVQVTAPDNGVAVNHYDSEGNLDYVQDPRGLRTYYTYNGLGQMLTQVSPDSGTTMYTYDTAGRPQSQTLANGLIITFGWDNLGRMTSRTSVGVTETFGLAPEKRTP